MTKEKTKKEKTTEVFEVGDEEIVKTSTSETKLENKGQKKKEEKTLRNILVILGIVLLFVVGYYFYAQSQITMEYKGIEFKGASYGENLILYETLTLLPSNDGTNQMFGFRIRTNPKELKKINFDGLEDYNLMKATGIKLENGTFNCEGDGVIAMPNMQRLFEKTGAQFIPDQEAECDEEGRYNLFILKYGDKTEISKIGNNCYEVIVKGNDESCEVLAATEKIMVETYVKYQEFQNE